MAKDLVEESIRRITIIGGGPGGYVAAIRAAQLGAKVVLIEQLKVGGTCLNRGCIPTKVMYRNAVYLEDLRKSDYFGVTVDGIKVDYQRFTERKNTVVNQLVTGVEKLLAANKVNVIYGTATIVKKGLVEVQLLDGSFESIESDDILIATGSSPTKPAIKGSNHPKVITSSQLIEMIEPPRSMTIIGGGVIGLEFAGILNAYGTNVTIIEAMPRLLPLMDGELSKRLTLSLKKKGIKIITNVLVKEIEETVEPDRTQQLEVTYESKGKIESSQSDYVLIATGRKPNVSGLNLEKMGIEYTKKGVVVDNNFSTNIDNIYAIGDVIGGQMLAHVASEEGIIAAEVIMSRDKKIEKTKGINYNAIPSCVFTFPEVACVGFGEEALKDKGIAYRKGKFLFGANGKALSLGEEEGFVKVLVSEKDALLGVHIMGPHASDLIHESALAITSGLGIKGIEETIHAHPTLSEAFSESVLNCDDKGIHTMPRRK